MKKLILLLIATVLFFSFCGKKEKTRLTLPAIFNDNMVLQQQSNVPVWGKACPGEKISVTTNWQETAVATANADGDWQVKIKTPKAGGPFEISVNGKRDTLNLKNILIGEVWVCSGQSNMEMPLKGWPPNDLIENSAEEIAKADYPEIRLFTVKRAIANTPQFDCVGEWTTCTPQTAADFSATAFFFGKKLNQKLNVPVGLIHSSWGGTPAEAWTPAEEISQMEDFAETVEKLKGASAQIKQLNTWLNKLPKIDMTKNNAEDRFKNIDFNDQKLAAVTCDDEKWSVMKLPTLWESTELGEFDGAVWFRKEVELTAGPDYKLELGPIDDMDVVYFNGKKVGGIEVDGFYSTSRKYDIPAKLVQKGKNVIAVRVLDTRGGGGIWGKPENMKIYPEKAADQAIELAGEWKYQPVAEFKNETFHIYGKGDNSFANRPKLDVDLTAYTPTTLYNGMISPILPFGIRGAIWYQGESNVGRAKQYKKLFPLMINSWRNHWNQGDFPFYYVQIAPYEFGQPDRSQYLREAQLQTLSVKNTGMVVTTDIGNPQNIHPAQKTEVGERLARWALNRDYGFEDLVPSGPIYNSMKVADNKIRIFFDYADMGLKCDGDELTHFLIADVNKNFVPAQAKIDGNTVLVWSDEVAEPIAVRFGWSNIAEPNLFNTAGLPASPFRTDNWE
jgi:sialate O-acetylesterase